MTAMTGRNGYESEYAPLGVEVCAGLKQIWVRDNNNDDNV